MIVLSEHNKSRFFIFAALAFICLLSTATSVYAQYDQSPLPQPTGYVNDYAGVVDTATKQRMETILENLKQRADVEFAVVTVKTTGDRDIFDYSLAVARGWKIGSSEGDKNGLLLLVAIDDHKYQIQVSRHLEGDLPDGLVGELGRRMREPFRRNDYSGGLMAAVQTFVATLGEKRGFSIEGIDQSNAYRAPTRTRDSGRSSGGLSPCMIIFIILIILIFLLSSRGRGGGCLNLFLLGSLFNSGSRGGWSSSGWGGGGFGGSSGGGGFGGFGGGGDFGGGGAGGSW